MAFVAAAALVISAAQAYNQYQSAKSAGKDAKAEKARLDAIRAELRALPPLELEKINYQYPELSSNIVDLISNVPVEKLDKSEMTKITTDPRLAEAQYSGLSTLDEISKEGMTKEDAYALEGIRQRSARDEASQRGAVLQNLAQRGLGGSGSEISARMMAAQGGANRASQQAMDLAQQKRAAALQAVLQRSNMATGMRDQQFGEKSDIAKAQDAIAQYNANAQNSAYDFQRNAITNQAQREDTQAQREWDAKYKEINANNMAKIAENASKEGRITGGPSSYQPTQDATNANAAANQAAATGAGTLIKTIQQMNPKTKDETSDTDNYA
jgi:hypothetical protein